MQTWFLLSYKELSFFTKNTKNNHFSTSDRWNTLNLLLKRILEHSLKVQSLKEFQDWKRGYETYTEKKISNQKLNQLPKIYKMSFIS